MKNFSQARHNALNLAVEQKALSLYVLASGSVDVSRDELGRLGERMLHAIINLESTHPDRLLGWTSGGISKLGEALAIGMKVAKLPAYDPQVVQWPDTAEKLILEIKNLVRAFEKPVV